ncbi:MAG: PaaI family thioesterase [Bacillota bacterium]|nr:PaaI family thioesterase [Bacillota bacterium]
MAIISEFYKNDKFSEHVGIELLEVSAGRAKAKLEIKKHHLNSVNIVHGAAIFALADLVFAVASNSHENISVAINANISFIKAVNSGILIAEGEEVSINPKLANYSIHIKDEKNDLVAVFQGMVYRKKEKYGSKDIKN